VESPAGEGKTPDVGSMQPDKETIIVSEKNRGKVIMSGKTDDQRNGYTIQFKLVSGEEALHDYPFNKKVAHHVFCSTCGIHSFSHGMSPDGRDMRVINLRCLDDIDIESLCPRKIDGRSW